MRARACVCVLECFRLLGSYQSIRSESYTQKDEIRTMEFIGTYVKGVSESYTQRDEIRTMEFIGT